MPSRVANYLELVHIAAAVTHKQPPGTNRNTTSEKKHDKQWHTHKKSITDKLDRNDKQWRTKRHTKTQMTKKWQNKWQKHDKQNDKQNWHDKQNDHTKMTK
jgi:hypothetical protein